ncbi:MAG: hypothetical protein JXB13_07565 [Phycisphaerae bacterium]|nr:hypothetical protein [Phycisphaerae bacterium]
MDWHRLFAPFLAGLAAIAVVAAAGVVPTVRLSGPDGLAGMAAGCAAGLAANWIGLLAFAVICRRRGGDWATAMLASTGVRFGAALLIGLLLAFSGRVSPRPFLIWLGLSYAVVLMIEVVCLVRIQRQVPGE